ncbi:MAG TPA: hypothetical protein VMH02_04780 [Verrucomicrobiae bacterium]|nr:hypothetical protein [Verrucomicrobiae bacterium]
MGPLGALAAQAAQLQSQIAAIDLGIQIEILQQQLSVGDLLEATVLPPQGGSDRLALLGLTVPAQLPPGIDPGESLLLQITGFANNQILVANLGTIDPNNPPQTATLQLPAPAGPVQQAILTAAVPVEPPPASPAAAAAAPPAAPASNAAPPSAAPVQAAPVPAAPSLAATAAPAVAQSTPPPVAPSRAVFVAASVQRAAFAPPGEQLARPASPSPPQAPLFRPAPAAAAATEESGDVEQLGLEARIAATRAASLDIAGLVTRQAGSPQGGQPARATVPPPVLPPRFQPASRPPDIAERPVPEAPVSPSRAQAGVAPSQEAELLERLGVPPAPASLAAARLVKNAATLLPRVLARLDAALAKVAPQDARAATLRTILSFAARLDPGNARALPEQIAAFVGNFVGGAESKLAALLRAVMTGGGEEPGAETAQPAPSADTPAAPGGAAAQPLPSAPAAPTAQGVPQAPAAPPAPSAPAAALAELSPALAARAAERSIALQYDAKATIASLIEAPPRGAPPELAPALAEAFATVTGMQLNVLNAQVLDPQTIAIPLPVFYHPNGAPVQLRVSRDAPGGGKLDGDNFSIAFVLDTKTLGTVAIDVQTVGRAVTLNVKTEYATAASRFRSTLGDLRGRLEELRYRVASATAGVAAHRPGAREEAPPSSEPLTDPAKSPPALDMQA